MTADMKRGETTKLETPEERARRHEERRQRKKLAETMG
jgi:hypothetical protein